MPEFPSIGLGCSRIGSFGTRQTPGEAVALIRRALDLGVTLFDTANIYGQGDSERAIGRALHHAGAAADRAIVVTKAGQRFSPRMRLLRPLKPLLRPVLARRAQGADNAVTARRADAMRSDWRAAALIDSLDGSLRRLRRESVDVFLLHSPPPAIIAEGVAIAALERAASSGRARLVGVACDDLAALDAALAQPVVRVLELPWDVLAAIAGTDRAATIATRGLIVIAREILRLQPGVAPMTAIDRATALPFVTTTLVGTTRPDRLEAIAQHVGGSGGGQRR